MFVGRGHPDRAASEPVWQEIYTTLRGAQMCHGAQNLTRADSRRV